MLKERKISLGSDIDLQQYRDHPQFYILEKYKSIFDSINSINDIKILLLNAENGDFVWRNSITHHLSQLNTFSTHQYFLNEPLLMFRPILNRFDSEHKVVDVSDYSQSSVLLFPHFYRNYHDSTISIKQYKRNSFHYRDNYLGFFGIAILQSR